MKNDRLPKVLPLSPATAPPYRYQALMVVALLHFIAMFLLPLLAYGGRLRIRLVNEVGHWVEEFPAGLVASAFTLFLAWVLLAVAGARLTRGIFSPLPITDSASAGEKIRCFWFFAVLGNLIMVIHLLVRFPASVENFMHLLAMMPCVTLVIGVSLLAGEGGWKSRSAASVVLATLLQYFLIVFLYLFTGRAAGGVLAFAVLIGALWASRVDRRALFAGFAVSGVIFCLAFWAKTPVRLLMAGKPYERTVISWSFPAETGVPPTIVDAEGNAVGGATGALAEAAAKPSARALSVGPALTLGGALANDVESFAHYDQNADLFLLDYDGLPRSLLHPLRRTVHRVNHLGILALVMARVPDREPYWGSEGYLPIVTSLVPRLLWPDKPSQEIGNVFGRRFQLSEPLDTETTVNLDPVTQGWLAAGPSGVVVSGLGLGALFGLVYAWLNRGGDQWERLFVFAAAVVSIASMEGDTALVIGGLLQALAMAFGFIVLRRLYMASRPPPTTA